MELWRFLGDWHPKLVQFPLVLLMVGLLLDLMGVVRQSARARWAALVSTSLGTLGLLFAFICGIYAEIWAGRAGVPQDPIELHESMANIASWGFVVLFAWRLLLAEAPAMGGPDVEASGKRRWLKVYVAAGLIWYSLLGLTAYLGGQLVFEYGAGVRGAHATALTFSDLNTLATRQTDENLRYSEWMHHIFGWMTLGLAASLLAQAIRPTSGRKLRWIVPVFLLAGGIFLFFMADLDLYKFTDLRQFRDREVQLHKVIASAMGTIGVIGLWRWVRRSGPGSRAGVQNDLADGGRKSNSKLVAVMALIGGALLFTHVHTVAPYANVAAGVYIAHVVMGLVALSIGAARVAQDYWPRRSPQLAGVFAVLMLCESVLLITYNEGLPWYIGYGRYNRWGPENVAGATVAPFGDFRAILWVDQKAGEAHVRLVDRYSEVPARVELRQPPRLLLSQGHGEIALPLLPDASGTWAWHAPAEFLKTAAFLSAKLEVHAKAGGDETGFFDPWVTPVIAAIPPNELATYVCPMHEGMRATHAGACPLCGMPLVEIRPPRPAGELHDAAFGLRVESRPAGAGGGLATRLMLRPQDPAGKPLLLARVHEQFIHVIIVSEDLTFFDHIHPLPPGERDPVAYTLDYTFPRAGTYLLFADLTPVGDRQQVFRTALQAEAGGVRVLQAGGTGRNALTADVAAGKFAVVIPAPATPQTSTRWTVDAPPGGALVRLISQPRTIYAGLHADLIFELTDAGGTPMTDLSPYLGAMGHCVAISEDTQEYVHSHPEQLLTPTAETRGGPEVAFHALFPRAGRYRLWAQFKHGEELIVASFTVEVKSPPVPAAWLRFLLNE